jgi:hypothetical protein
VYALQGRRSHSAERQQPYFGLLPGDERVWLVYTVSSRSAGCEMSNHVRDKGNRRNHAEHEWWFGGVPVGVLQRLVGVSTVGGDSACDEVLGVMLGDPSNSHVASMGSSTATAGGGRGVRWQ